MCYFCFTVLGHTTLHDTTHKNISQVTKMHFEPSHLEGKGVTEHPPCPPISRQLSGDEIGCVQTHPL